MISNPRTHSLQLDDKETENSSWESDSSYEEMLEDRAPSSTYVSTWGYGEYYTRRAYSQDTRSSYRDSSVTRGDFMSFKRRNGGHQSGVATRVLASGAKTQDLENTPIPQDSNAARVNSPPTADGLVEGMDIDTSIFASNHDGLSESVEMRVISVSTDLVTYDYGLNWRRKPSSPDVPQNSGSLTNPQDYSDSPIIQEIDNKDEAEIQPVEIMSTNLAASISEDINPGPQADDKHTSNDMPIVDPQSDNTPGNHSAVAHADEWFERSPSPTDLDGMESSRVGGNYISTAPIDFSYFRSSWSDQRPSGW